MKWEDTEKGCSYQFCDLGKRGCCLKYISFTMGSRGAVGDCAARLASNMVLPGRHDKNRRMLCHSIQSTAQCQHTMPTIVVASALRLQNKECQSQYALLPLSIIILSLTRVVSTKYHKVQSIDFVDQYLTGQPLLSIGSILFNALFAHFYGHINIASTTVLWSGQTLHHGGQ
ncbi:hypothetical protein LguiA_025972 [Lonicera macranthoides]